MTQTATGRYDAGTNLETDPLPAATSTHRRASFSYHAGGLIASMIDPRGYVTNLDYDRPKGYLTKIDAPAGAGEASRRGDDDHAHGRRQHRQRGRPQGPQDD